MAHRKMSRNEFELGNHHGTWGSHSNTKARKDENTKGMSSNAARESIDRPVFNYDRQVLPIDWH